MTTTPDNSDKRCAIRRLAEKRGGHRTPRGYRHIESISEENATDEFVVPWTKSANNVNARVMLVAQDWNSIDSLTEGAAELHQQTTGQSRKFGTNKAVRALLREFLGLRFCDTYATDIVSFLKPGDAGAEVSASALVHCAETFTIEEIKIVQPQIVICIGRRVYQTILDALHYTGHDVIEKDNHHYVSLHNSDTPHVVTFFETYHPSYYSRQKQEKRNVLIASDWSPIKHHYDTSCPTAHLYSVRQTTTPCPLFVFKVLGNTHSCHDSCDDYGNIR